MKLGVLLIFLASIADYAIVRGNLHVTNQGTWSEAHGSYQNGGRPQTRGVQTHSKLTFTRINPHYQHTGFRETFQEHYKQTFQTTSGSKGQHIGTTFVSAHQNGNNAEHYQSVSPAGNHGVHSFGHSNNGHTRTYFGADRQNHGFRDTSHFGTHHTGSRTFPKLGHNRQNSLDHGPHSSRVPDYIPREIMRAIKQSSVGFVPNHYHGNEQNFGGNPYGHNFHANIDQALRAGQDGVLKNVQNTFNQILRHFK